MSTYIDIFSLISSCYVVVLVYFARPMHSTAKFATTVLIKCVCVFACVCVLDVATCNQVHKKITTLAARFCVSKIFQVAGCRLANSKQ